ncbi:hypothetical protein EDC65_1985 [Stella humosa]|uniref:Phage portal protein n=1 Tax=Stella humosa TaxID=94 RepID=A0A3N1MAA7_9PROT|nr:hypothetical protein [Stella humosa]ROQ00189.1 hypothetical protein EDC65_1985 [Stella humosa]BBK30576.1 hypothetical protein STHU_12100 [Stella humosa]
MAGAEPDLAELGRSGLRAWSGLVREEFLPELQGRRGVAVYREMAANDPVVGAVLFAVEMTLRGVPWSVEPAGGDAAARDGARFLESVRDDMSHGFDDFLVEVLGMLVHGWAWFEIVWKRRPADGRIGLRKLALRGQETLLRWEFDPAGGVRGLWQAASPEMPQPVFVPIEKSLLFRTTTAKGNPEGRSILRNAYRPWYFKKRLEEGEAIGYWRALGGLPVARIPARFMAAGAAPEERALFEDFQRIVRDTQVDERAGLVLPSDRDEHGHPYFEFGLLGAPSGQSVPIREAIVDRSREIAMTALADFILLGRDGNGSYALARDKGDRFETALTAWLGTIAAVLNRHLVPRLWRINALPPATMPRFVPGRVGRVDAATLAGLVERLAAAGVPLFPDDGLARFLRTAAGLPLPDPNPEQS